MRRVGISRQVIRLGAAVAGLATPKFHLGLGITAATAIAALLPVLVPARHDWIGRAH